MLSAVLGILDSAGKRVDAALKTSGGFLPVWLKLGTGVSASAAANGKGDVEVTLSVTGQTPTTRTIAATSPIRIDGGASADLSTDRTISILAASAATANYVVQRDGSGDAALRRLTAERVIGSGPGLYLYGDASGTAQAIDLLGSIVGADVDTTFYVRVNGGTSQIDVQVNNTYLYNQTQIELDAPRVLVDGVLQFPEQAAPSPHATLGQMYYSSADHKLHFLDSNANGAADHALW